ncbi:MAG: SEC-C metal-binding domain-containing protein [Gemmataceae bacterium]
MGAIADGFVAYAQILLDKTDGSKEQLNKALRISQVCFNLALMPDDSRDTRLNDLRLTLKMDEKEFDEFRRSTLDPMIDRHKEMFPRMHGRSGYASPSSPSVWTQPEIAVRSDSFPGTDRYGPCPCNSGKKYKFCCGKKGR